MPQVSARCSTHLSPLPEDAERVDVARREIGTRSVVGHHHADRIRFDLDLDRHLGATRVLDAVPEQLVSQQAQLLLFLRG